MRLRGAVALCLCLWVGCRSPTEIVLEVHSELSGVGTYWIRVRRTGGSATKVRCFTVDGRDAELPLTLGLVPASPDVREVEVTAAASSSTGLSDDCPETSPIDGLIVEERMTAQFVTGARRVVAIRLGDEQRMDAGIDAGFDASTDAGKTPDAGSCQLMVFAASADTQIDEAPMCTGGETPLGDADRPWVSTNGDEGESRVLLRFDVSPLDLPNSEITSGRVLLDVPECETCGGSIHAYVMRADWDESSATWCQRSDSSKLETNWEEPGAAGDQYDVGAAGPITDVLDATSGELGIPIRVDDLGAFLPRNQIAIQLRGEADTAFSFYSKEGADGTSTLAPRLELTLCR